LLWSCDFNAVRGETRLFARNGRRPMLWHIYRQDEDIHLDKLEAFLAFYPRSFPRLARRSAVFGGHGMAANRWPISGG
jgi:hypothetical protein